MMVDEIKYHIEVTQLACGFEEATFLGRIIENESGKVVCECEDTDENFVYTFLKNIMLDFDENYHGNIDNQDIIDESKYHLKITQPTSEFIKIFRGMIVENKSGEVVYTYNNFDKEEVNNRIEERLTYLNKYESGKADIPNVDYYQQGGIECKEYLEAKGFAEGFYRGSAIKYITRAGKKCKDTEIQDLEKARDFINFEIERLRAEHETI